MQNVFFILGFFGLWLLILTGLLVYIFNFFRKLSVGVDRESLIKTLKSVLQKEVDNSKNLEDVQKTLKDFQDESNYHLQKIGFLRFNPFKELGGEHSFCAVMLDGNNSGLIITGLHSRERTRVYVKDVIKGKSKIELSQEEKKALAIAKKDS